MRRISTTTTIIIKISSVNSEIFQICHPCTFFLLCLKRYPPTHTHFKRAPENNPRMDTTSCPMYTTSCLNRHVGTHSVTSCEGGDFTLLFQYGDTSDVGSCRNQTKRRELKYGWHLKGQIRDFSGDFKMLLGSWHIVGTPPIDFNLDFLSYVFHTQFICLFLKINK